MNNKFNKKQILKAAVLVLSLFTFHFSLFTVSAHRYHTSLTRMDYNANEKLVEVTIQLFTHDLVPVLEKQTKKTIDLEKTSDIDKILLEYLDRNFVLKNSKGEVQKLNWVGKEIKTDTVYVYIEIPLPEALEGSQLQNTIFFESFAEQTNLVNARFNDKKADLLFVVGDKFKEITTK